MASALGALVKAKIFPVDLSIAALPVMCYFNPAKITVSKNASWTKTDTAGDKIANVPKYNFKGVDGQSMNMDLFFDTTDLDVPMDVRLMYTNRLFALMEPKGLYGLLGLKMKHPPKVRFQWGTSMSFTAAIASVKVDYTFFSPSGIPLRAKASVSFTQVKDDEMYLPTNPTSGGDVRESYLVHEGDRLDLIAHKVYKDSSLWRLIAEANGIENPLSIKPGQRLLLPEQITGE